MKVLPEGRWLSRYPARRISRSTKSEARWQDAGKKGPADEQHTVQIEEDTVILNVHRAAGRWPYPHSDLFRSALRPFVAIFAATSFLLLARAAGAAEQQVNNIFCGETSQPVAQLVPAGNRITNVVDMTGSQAVTFERFEWACTPENISFHMPDIKTALRSRGIGNECDAGIRVLPLAGRNDAASSSVGAEPRTNDLHFPLTIPASGSDPSLDLAMQDALFNPSTAQVTPCSDGGGWHPTIARCFAEGKAILISSPDAVSFDPDFGDRKVVGVIHLWGDTYGYLAVWVPGANMYQEPGPIGAGGYSKALCRMCLLESSTQEIIRAAVRRNFVVAQPQPAANTSVTETTSPITTSTSDVENAPSPPEQPSALAELYREFVRPYLGWIVAVVFGVILLSSLGAIRRSMRIARERRRLGRIKDYGTFVDEKVRELEYAQRQLEREMRDIANEQ